MFLSMVKNHITFKEISIENEMHYDGISSTHKSKIPNYIFFYVEKINNMNDKMKNKGEFKLLNSLGAVKDIPSNLLKNLKTKILNFMVVQRFIILILKQMNYL